MLRPPREEGNQSQPGPEQAAAPNVRAPVPSLRCAALCCAVLCCAVLCCAVLCCAVLCCAVLWRARPFKNTASHMAAHHVMGRPGAPHLQF
jgi:hypothetical protein